jgi:hypothetical protein
MNGLQRAVGIALGAATLAVVPLLRAQTADANPAEAGSGALARCAAITGPDARLACYDALAGRATPTPAATPATVTSAAVAGAVRPIAATAAPPAAPAPAPAAADVQAFGLTPAQTHTPPPGPEALEARVVKVQKDQYSHASVELDNGQLWAINGVVDASLDAGDAVKIERAALGSYLMTTSSKHAYRVTRIR